MKVAEMKKGDTRIIVEITDPELTLKLLEMGCIPGNKITYNYRAPLGDPISVSVAGYELSLRVSEASSIIVE